MSQRELGMSSIPLDGSFGQSNYRIANRRTPGIITPGIIKDHPSKDWLNPRFQSSSHHI